MRVLRVIARLNLGGPAHQVSLLSGRRFDPARFDTLLVHGSLAAGEESLADMAEAEGARCEYLPQLGQPVSPLRDAAALARLRSIVRRFRPDIIHTHTAKAGFVGRAAGLLSQPRPALVHTFHGHVLEGYFGPVKTGAFRRVERALGKRSDRLIGVSRATVEDLVRLGVGERERFRVVPLGLDLAPFAAAPAALRAETRRQLGIAEEEVMVSFVGRVVPIKRIDVLLRATAHARELGAPVRLVIAGDGEIRPAMAQLAAELGIAEHVQFLGYRRDLPALAAAADIAAISSDNEGTPVSLIEAAAAGVPAVATDVGGVSDVVIEGESGFMVDRGNAVALGGVIARLAGDAELRALMGARAQEHALSRFSIGRLIDDMTALYEELMAKRAGRSAP